MIDIDREKVKEAYKELKSYRKVARMFNVSYMTIQRIVNDVTKSKRSSQINRIKEQLKNVDWTQCSRCDGCGYHEGCADIDCCIYILCKIREVIEGEQEMPETIEEKDMPDSLCRFIATERYCSIANAIMRRFRSMIDLDQETDVIDVTGWIKGQLISTGCFAEKDFENWH